VERARATPSVDAIVVATTVEPEDDVLAAWLRDAGIDTFRGSQDDVLDRFYRCASTRTADLIVRITADDPFKDPEVNERAIGALLADPELDYCSNTLEPTFPEGLDVEAFRFSALERAFREAKLPSEREHVTPYIWKHPKLFRVANFRHDTNLSDWRWTIDKPNDLTFARAVFSQFAGNPMVGFRDIIDWLQLHPEVRAINADTIRNEGYLKSLQSE
jgi:spore coat polysaccharide biosynthesis protein SpsF